DARADGVEERAAGAPPAGAWIDDDVDDVRRAAIELPEAVRDRLLVIAEEENAREHAGRELLHARERVGDAELGKEAREDGVIGRGSEAGRERHDAEDILADGRCGRSTTTAARTRTPCLRRRKSGPSPRSAYSTPRRQSSWPWSR